MHAEHALTAHNRSNTMGKKYLEMKIKKEIMDPVAMISWRHERGK